MDELFGFYDGLFVSKSLRTKHGIQWITLDTEVIRAARKQWDITNNRPTVPVRWLKFGP